MKIFILGADSGEYPSFFYQCKKSFEDLGHEINFFNYRYFRLHKLKFTNKILNKVIFNKIKKYNPDILLVIKGESLEKGIIKNLSQAGIKTINWTLDSPFGDFYPGNKIYNINEYNYFFVFDSYYVDKLRDINPNSYYLACAADPKYVHREVIPLENRNYIYDVSFVGSYQPEREDLFNSLGVKIHIFGPSWHRAKNKENFIIQETYLNGKEMNKVFNLSKINLNIQALHGKNSMNLRTFEVPSTKSFILTDYKKDLPELFEIDKEIVFYKNKDDLREKINYYLDPSNEEERINIIKAGYERVLNEHTIHHRIKEVIRIIK